MNEQNYLVEEMISAEEIANRIRVLAAEITSHFAGTEKLVVVGLLRGSFVFIADLVRSWPGFGQSSRELNWIPGRGPG